MSKILKRLAVTGTALMLMLGLGVITAQPALAWTCSSGYLCLWTGANMSGSKKTISVGVGSCYNLTGSWDENVSSAANEDEGDYYMYEAPNCALTGYRFTIFEWVHYNFTGVLNNSASSIAFSPN